MTSQMETKEGGRPMNAGRLGLFADCHYRLENAKAKCGVAGGQLYTMALMLTK